MSRRQNPYRSDHRTQAARAKGYPARSVFKLEEIDQRVGLLGPGQRVLDLGAAPGSWSLYAAGRVGASGKVLAVDLQEIEQAFPAWVTTAQQDALALEAALHEGFAPYDVVLSDMAPKTGGDKFTNAARSFDLFMAALEVARCFGTPGSHFVAKLFMGEDFEHAKRAVAEAYQKQRVIKPKGTRSNSVELFIVGQGLKAAAPDPEQV